MPKFQLTVLFSGTKEITVEADNEEDAVAKFDPDKLNVDDWDVNDTHVAEVVEVES